MLLFWLIGFTAVVMVLAAFTGAILHNGGWRGYLKLTSGGISTEGVIARVEKNNHCLAEFTFLANGHNYSGRGTSCVATVGQKVQITYLAKNPTLSCLGSARDALHNELFTFLIGGIVFPPLILFGIRRKFPNFLT